MSCPAARPDLSGCPRSCRIASCRRWRTAHPRTGKRSWTSLSIYKVPSAYMLQNAAMALTLNRRIGKMDPSSRKFRRPVGQQARLDKVAGPVAFDRFSLICIPNDDRRRVLFVGRKCPARDNRARPGASRRRRPFGGAGRAVSSPRAGSRGVLRSRPRRRRGRARVASLVNFLTRSKSITERSVNRRLGSTRRQE